MHTLLTRSDFESAVKDALRHYTRTDLLTGNALLHAQLLTQSDSGRGHAERPAETDGRVGGKPVRQ